MVSLTSSSEHTDLTTRNTSDALSLTATGCVPSPAGVTLALLLVDPVCKLPCICRPLHGKRTSQHGSGYASKTAAGREVADLGRDADRSAEELVVEAAVLADVLLADVDRHREGRALVAVEVRRTWASGSAVERWQAAVGGRNVGVREAGVAHAAVEAAVARARIEHAGIRIAGAGVADAAVEPGVRRSDVAHAHVLGREAGVEPSTVVE